VDFVIQTPRSIIPAVLDRRLAVPLKDNRPLDLQFRVNALQGDVEFPPVAKIEQVGIVCPARSGTSPTSTSLVHGPSSMKG
jgi:hypothetical protein